MGFWFEKFMCDSLFMHVQDYLNWQIWIWKPKMVIK